MKSPNDNLKHDEDFEKEDSRESDPALAEKVHASLRKLGEEVAELKRNRIL